MSFKDEIIYFGETPVPIDILTASLKNYGDQSKLYSYINGWITEYRKDPINTASISNLYPFFEDGTLFIRHKVDFEETITKYWPTITSGVKKKLANLLRASFRLEYFLVSVFDFDTNNQIRALDYIATTAKAAFDPSKDLEFIRKFKGSQTHELLGFQHYNNLVKHLSNDIEWFTHLKGVHATVIKLYNSNPNMYIPLYYPLNTMVSNCNYMSSGIGKHKVIFNKYVHMYEFFDGIEVQGYSLRIPKDNVDLAYWGKELSICVGGDSYVGICNKCGDNDLLYMFDKDCSPKIMAYISKGHVNQIHGKNNSKISESNPALYDEIAKVGLAIIKKDIAFLKTYITPEHMTRKAEKYHAMGMIDKADVGKVMSMMATTIFKKEAPVKVA